MRALNRIVSGIVLGFLFACAANAQHEAVVATRIAEIKRTYPCADSIRIRTTASDKRLLRDACWLVGLGLHEIAVGNAERFGIARADTGVVTAASLAEFRFKGLRGAADEWYWLVTLTIAGKPRTLDVYIQQLEPTVKVTPTERVSGM